VRTDREYSGGSLRFLGSACGLALAAAAALAAVAAAGQEFPRRSAGHVGQIGEQRPAAYRRDRGDP
jgi:hypothetical protein